LRSGGARKTTSGLIPWLELTCTSRDGSMMSGRQDNLL
jgi:hypothetical protein